MPNNKSTQPNAINHIAQIKEVIRDKNVAFFLDYDGTLTPIVAKPELAVLDQDTRTCLQQLSQQYFVAVISGRALNDVRNLVAINTIYYAGNHGLEVAGPHSYQIKHELKPDFINLLNTVYQELVTKLHNIKNVIIENKLYSLSIHYRLVESHYIKQIEKTIDAIISQHPKLIKRHGKKVFEIRPRLAWNKGKVIFYLMQQLHMSLDTIMPIYIGDDVTDEDAFRALKNKGISILVARHFRETAADYNLIDTQEVKTFLQAFIQ